MAEKVMQIIEGYWKARCTFVVAELGVADVLKDGKAHHIDEIAMETKTIPEFLYRVMRALAMAGVFVEKEGKMFENNEVSCFLRSDVPGSKRSFARVQLGGEHDIGMSRMLDCVRTGQNGVQLTLGEGLFEIWKKPEWKERANLFNTLMTDFSLDLIPEVVGSYNFDQYPLIIDIGGSLGTLLRSVLEKAPTSTGICFDLPNVVEHAKVESLKDPILTKSVQFIGGDFFQSVPEGGDLYMMKFIIHDWPDDKCEVILKNIRKAMKPSSKLLIFEQILPGHEEPHFGKFTDLIMMAITEQGKERTEQEFGQLASKANMKINQIFNKKGRLAIIELVPI